MESIAIVEIDGKLVPILSEVHFDCKPGQTEDCACCGNPKWPECTKECVPFNRNNT